MQRAIPNPANNYSLPCKGRGGLGWGKPELAKTSNHPRTAVSRAEHKQAPTSPYTSLRWGSAPPQPNLGALHASTSIALSQRRRLSLPNLLGRISLHFCNRQLESVPVTQRLAATYPFTYCVNAMSSRSLYNFDVAALLASSAGIQF